MSLFFPFYEPNAPPSFLSTIEGVISDWFYLVSPFPSGLHTHSAERWVSKVMGMIWNVTLKDKMIVFNRTQTRVLIKRQSLFEQRTSCSLISSSERKMFPSLWMFICVTLKALLAESFKAPIDLHAFHAHIIFPAWGQAHLWHPCRPRTCWHFSSWRWELFKMHIPKNRPL